MTELLLTAPSSGSGKTSAMCALLTLFQRKGMRPCAFKCGPDYIDPMFHRSVLDVDSCNLDLFLTDEETVRKNYEYYSAYCDAAIIEGVMGHYDGLGGSTPTAGSWHLADTLDVPSLLVVRPGKNSLTLAAELKGILDFRENSHIAGILLNDCVPADVTRLADILERETGIPVVGCLPHVEGAELSSRHLGLVTADEVQDLQHRVSLLTDALEENLDWDKLLSLCGNRPAKVRTEMDTHVAKTVIAFACDKAFSFYYRDALDALWKAGADLYLVSPLHDHALPDAADGLYLPGGYPELYARELSENESMRESVQRAVQGGMPTVAECGGFLYLGQSLEGADGKVYPMAGALPGKGYRTNHPVRFGYATLTAEGDSLLLKKGDTLPVHSFHYWDSTEPGNALSAEKPVTGRSWKTGFASPSLYAAFEHFDFSGKPELVRRFLRAAEEYHAREQ